MLEPNRFSSLLFSSSSTRVVILAYITSNSIQGQYASMLKCRQMFSGTFQTEKKELKICLYDQVNGNSIHSIYAERSSR